MTTNTLVLIGGLPGAGKSTEARRRTDGTVEACRVEADQYFMVEGRYVFEPAKLGEAHAWCRGFVSGAMDAGVPLVVVSNTFSRRWEREPYVTMAREYGYAVEWVDLFDAGLSDAELAARNVHGVSAEVIARMRARWERGLE